MMYLMKWCIYSEHSGNHIVSLCDDGTYQCDCVGWTRHMPRRNCKHIYQVIDEKPEPLDQKNWDALKGKKKKVLDAIAKMEQANIEPEIITTTININGQPFSAYRADSFFKNFGGRK